MEGQDANYVLRAGGSTHVDLCTFMSRPQVNLRVASLRVIHFVIKAGSLSCPLIRLNLQVS